MYIEAIILGLIVGFARNGRIANFFEVRFKGWALSIFAFILFLIPYLLRIMESPFEKLQIFPFLAMVLCAMIALLNFEKTGMKILFVGILLNLVVMGFNDFKMPIDAIKMGALGFASFIESLKEGYVVNYMSMDGAHPISALLGKVIALPDFYPLKKVLSIGDLIISLGIAMIIQYEMLLSSVKSRGSMVHFSYNTRLRR